MYAIGRSTECEDMCYEGWDNPSRYLTYLAEVTDDYSRFICNPPMFELGKRGMPWKANLRLQLQRAQLAEDTEKEKYRSVHTPSTRQQHTHIPISQLMASTPVPVQFHKAKSKYQTQSNVQKGRERRIRTFLNRSNDDKAARQPFLNLPSMTVGIADLTQNGSSPVTPDNLLPAGIYSSASSTSDTTNLLSDIISLEPVEATVDHGLSLIEPSLTQMSIFQSNVIDTADEGTKPAESVTSGLAVSGLEEIPPFMTTEELRHWQKDRKKRFNHNIIEKRRRVNINNRIKELGTLLPETLTQVLGQNKSTILKASADYIKELKKDQDRRYQLEERQQMLEETNRKMLHRIQQLEHLLDTKISSSCMQDGIGNLSTMTATEQLQQQNVLLGQTHSSPKTVNRAPVEALNHQYSLLDNLMDDSCSLGMEQMLSSEPVCLYNSDVI